MMHPIAYARSARLQEPASQPGGIDPRLKPAAHAFEASLIQELLKPMQQDPLFSDSSGESGGGGLSSGMADGGMDTMSSLSAQALARAISDRGGLGIAAEVLKDVQAQKAGEESSVKAEDKKKKAAPVALHKLGEGQSHLLPWSSVRRIR